MFGMIGKGSVGGTTLDVTATSFLLVAQVLLKLEDKHLDESDGAFHLSDSDLGGTTIVVLLDKFGSLHISIAVLEFAIFDAHGMNHTISIEEMISVIRWVMGGIWTVPEVYSTNISGSTINRLLGDLGLDRSPISIESKIRLIILEGEIEHHDDWLKEEGLEALPEGRDKLSKEKPDHYDSSRGSLEITSGSDDNTWNYHRSHSIYTEFL
jgi:hypothetical protein